QSPHYNRRFSGMQLVVEESPVPQHGRARSPAAGLTGRDPSATSAASQAVDEAAVTAPVKIAIAGALGRMGQAVAAAVETRQDVAVVARFDRPDAPQAGLVPMDAALEAAEVVIDFTTASASTALAAHCAAT